MTLCNLKIYKYIHFPFIATLLEHRILTKKNMYVSLSTNNNKK